MSDTLASALALVQTKLPTIAKTQTATVKSDKGTYTYDYADLADVSEQILPLLADAGLAWTCRPTLTEEGKFVLAYKLLHISGESEEGQYPLPNSGTPQAMGAAISYARRYALCAVTGVAPKGDDNDAVDAPKTRTAQRQSRPAQRSQEAAPVAQRTAQRAQVDGPPLPGDDGPKLLSASQRGMVLALFGKAGIDERDERLDISRRIVGRADLGSANELTSKEASTLIDALQEGEQHPQGFSAWLAELLAKTEGES
jgi:ERF superfamily